MRRLFSYTQVSVSVLLEIHVISTRFQSDLVLQRTSTFRSLQPVSKFWRSDEYVSFSLFFSRSLSLSLCLYLSQYKYIEISVSRYIDLSRSMMLFEYRHCHCNYCICRFPECFESLAAPEPGTRTQAFNLWAKHMKPRSGGVEWYSRRLCSVSCELINPIQCTMALMNVRGGLLKGYCGQPKLSIQSQLFWCSPIWFQPIDRNYQVFDITLLTSN